MCSSALAPEGTQALYSDWCTDILKKKDLSFYSRKGQTHHSASVYMVSYAKLSQQLFIIMRNPPLKKKIAVTLVLFIFLKEFNLELLLQAACRKHEPNNPPNPLIFFILKVETASPIQINVYCDPFPWHH